MIPETRPPEVLTTLTNPGSVKGDFFGGDQPLGIKKTTMPFANAVAPALNCMSIVFAVLDTRTELGTIIAEPSPAAGVRVNVGVAVPVGEAELVGVTVGEAVFV